MGFDVDEAPAPVRCARGPEEFALRAEIEVAGYRATAHDRNAAAVALGFQGVVGLACCILKCASSHATLAQCAASVSHGRTYLCRPEMRRRIRR